MTARLLLLAAMLPLAGFAQLELTLYNTANNTETPIDLTQALDVGSAAACQTLTPRLRIHNIGSTAVEITTLLVAVTGSTPAGVFTTDSRDPLPGSSFLVAGASFRDIWIDFAPGAPGQFTGTLTVNTIVLALAGEGITAPTVIDSTGRTYCPGDEIYVGRTQVGTTAQTILTLGNPTQSATTATVAGTDFGPATPLTVAAGATQTLPVTFTPSIPNTEAGTLTVGGLVYNLGGDGFAAPPPQPALRLSSNTNQSSNQAQVSIPLSAAATSTDTGTLTLTFQPEGNLADDPNINFPATGGTRIMSVQVHPGDTAVHFQAGDPDQGTFQTGTTAGTITLTLSLTISGVTANASTTITPAAVVLDLSTAVPATGEIIVSLAGFDNTHAASALAFTFYDATGKAVAPGLIQSDVTSAFANYYKANPQSGGTFNLQATFPVTGDITQVATVQVQFTNPAGVTNTTRLPVE